MIFPNKKSRSILHRVMIAITTTYLPLLPVNLPLYWNQYSYCVCETNLYYHSFIKIIKDKYLLRKRFNSINYLHALLVSVLTSMDSGYPWSIYSLWIGKSANASNYPRGFDARSRHSNHVLFYYNNPARFLKYWIGKEKHDFKIIYFIKIYSSYWK